MSEWEWVLELLYGDNLPFPGKFSYFILRSAIKADFYWNCRENQRMYREELIYWKVETVSNRVTFYIAFSALLDTYHCYCPLENNNKSPLLLGRRTYIIWTKHPGCFEWIMNSCGCGNESRKEWREERRRSGLWPPTNNILFSSNLSHSLSRPLSFQKHDYFCERPIAL